MGMIVKQLIGGLQIPLRKTWLGRAFHNVGKSVGTHPIVVEDLLHIAAAGIGQQRHYQLVFIQIMLASVFEGCHNGHAGRSSDQQAFLRSQTTGHFERFGIVHLHDFVGKLTVKAFG